MAHQIETYACEWKTTIADPTKLMRFRHFINSDQPDPSLVQVEERGQKRPAFNYEKDLVATSDRS
jgi:nitrite reductase (NADH) large subunit